MNEQKAVPNIRFKGFDDKFKVGKLKNYFIIKDGTHSSPQYIKSGFPLITSKNLKESGLQLENVSYISKSDFDEINKRSKVDVGDILFGMIGTIGTPVMIKENNFAIKNVALIKELSKPEVLNIWLIYYFQSPAFDKFIHFKSTGGTQRFLALGVIQNMEFKFPLKKEQQKISDLFTKLDKLLDLQQQKIDKLELLKKALLQKLFPRHDAQIPEFRFKGCNGEWEDCLVGNLLEVVPNKKYITEASKKGLNPVIQQGEKPILGFSNKAPYKEYKKVVLFGDHTLSLYKPESPFLIATDGIKILYVKDWNGYFLFAFLQKYKPDSEGYKRHFSILKSKKAKFTVIDEEQQKIGNLLSKVDQLIELENKKLHNLQQVKKCLLQNMFVE